jgi:hypothetical protein
MAAEEPSIAMQRRDRPWVDANVTVVCGPFAMPPTNSIRQAVTDIVDRYPESRLQWAFDSTRTRWIPGRSAESIVIERDWDDAPHFGAILDEMARDATSQPPLSFVRYPNYFGMKMSHSLGDGPIFMSAVATVFLTAISGQTSVWPPELAGRFPLLRAVLRTFGSNPSRVWSAMRDRPQVAQTVDTAEPKKLPWNPSRRTVHTIIDPALTAEIYSCAKKAEPGASRFGILAALLLRALSRAGVSFSPDVRVMMDLRGYLGDRLIDGNFVAGVPIRMSGDMSPGQIASMVRDTRNSGRPLANQVATSIRLGSALPIPATIEEHALPQVTFSYLGAPPLVDCLPYLAGQRPTYAASVEPGGPNGLTFLLGHVNGGIILNAIFHDNIVDAAQVEAAVQMVNSDPVGLLSGKAG